MNLIIANDSITAPGVLTATSIEDYDFYGTNSNDAVLGGGDGDNYLDGRGGDDILDGGAGNDELVAGRGSDSLNGGEGDDRLSTFLYLSFDYDTVFDQNVLNGDAGNDVISSFRGGNNTLNGGTGDDIINVVIGGFGNTIVDGGAGTDFLGLTYDRNAPANLTIAANNSISLPGLLTVTNMEGYEFRGSRYDDSVLGGGASDNKLFGFQGDDILEGGAGNDILIGGNGNDTLKGGQGSDNLTGGAGVDRLVYATASAYSAADVGRDRIVNFFTGTDKIVLSQTTFTAMTSAMGDGFSNAAEFEVVATDAAARVSGAAIAYNSVNGKLFYNQNGSAAGLGTGSNFAVLVNNLTLSANDFVLQS